MLMTITRIQKIIAKLRRGFDTSSGLTSAETATSESARVRWVRLGARTADATLFTGWEDENRKRTENLFSDRMRYSQQGFDDGTARFKVDISPTIKVQDKRCSQKCEYDQVKHSQNAESLLWHEQSTDKECEGHRNDMRKGEKTCHPSPSRNCYRYISRSKPVVILRNRPKRMYAMSRMWMLLESKIQQSHARMLVLLTTWCPSHLLPFWPSRPSTARPCWSHDLIFSMASKELVHSTGSASI